MKKFLLSLVALLFSVCSFADVVVTFDGTETTWTGNQEAQTETKDGVTMSVTQGVYSASSAHYRFYKSQVLSFESTVGHITKIEFTCTANNTAQYGPGSMTAQSGSYTFEGKVGTWVGAADSVKFDMEKAQVRATQIVVTVSSGDAPAVPVIDAPAITPKGGTYTSTQTVTITAPEGYGIIYTLDGSTPEDGNGTTVAEGSATFTVSATTTVKAIAIDNDDPDNHSAVATSTITIAKQVEIPTLEHITIGEFLKRADTETAYEVCGVVTSIVNTTYGNLYIAEGTDTLYIYGILDQYGQTQKFKNLNIELNDTLTLQGKYTLYKETIEMSNAQFVSVKKYVPKEPEAPYELAGDGTFGKAYTADDVKYLYDHNLASKDYVWVKGVIQGSAKSANALNPDTLQAATNIALGTAESWIPVQLPAGDVRFGLNVKDNPSNIGKEVWVYGTIEAYFQTAGVKNVTKCSLDGVNEYVKPQVVPGDANEDGNVDVFDVTAIASYILDPTTPVNVKNADVNGDGEINVFDITAVSGIILGTAE